MNTNEPTESDNLAKAFLALQQTCERLLCLFTEEAAWKQQLEERISKLENEMTARKEHPPGRSSPTSQPQIDPKILQSLPAILARLESLERDWRERLRK